MGKILLYTGTGGGKTMIAVGLGVRAVGHGKKVLMVQFMKGRKDIGEFMAQKHLPGFEIVQFGRKEFVDLKNPSKEDMELAKKGLEYVRNLKKMPDLLILDEINLACTVGLLKIRDVIEVLDKIPEKTTVVLTGRYAPKELIEKADLVTEIKDVKELKGKLGEGVSY